LTTPQGELDQAIRDPQWDAGSDQSDGGGELETGSQGTSKTSRSPFAGFAGPLGERCKDLGSAGAAVAAMDLETFSQAGLIVRVRSKVLGTTVLFVSNNVPEAALAETIFPVYRASELRKLATLKPAPRSLQTIHDAKTIFEGVITDG
jgi:hypothetical protein